MSRDGGDLHDENIGLRSRGEDKLGKDDARDFIFHMFKIL